MADKAVRFLITGEAASLVAASKEGSAALNGLGKTAKTHGSTLDGLKGHMRGLVGGFIGFEAVKIGAEFLVDATKAAEDDQVQMANVANANEANPVPTWSSESW